MNVGGQAVIEGVMMRNKNQFAVAVRAPDGKIILKKEESHLPPKLFMLPFLRGTLMLFYTLYDGIRALMWSSNQQLEVDEKISTFEAILTIAVSFIFAIGFFIGVPFLISYLVNAQGAWFDVLDGVIRASLFIGYLLLISQLKDVRTLFAYHGAEHKSIACYEANEELTLENARRYSRFHPRCGTSFIFFVLVLSIITFALIPGGLLVKLLGRIVLIPVISSLSYEIIKFSSKYDQNILMRALTKPGLWLQRITTNEPTDAQLEVGLASLKAVLE